MFGSCFSYGQLHAALHTRGRIVTGAAVGVGVGVGADGVGASVAADVGANVGADAGCVVVVAVPGALVVFGADAGAVVLRFGLDVGVAVCAGNGIVVVVVDSVAGWTFTALAVKWTYSEIPMMAKTTTIAKMIAMRFVLVCRSVDVVCVCCCVCIWGAVHFFFYCHGQSNDVVDNQNIVRDIQICHLHGQIYSEIWPI